MSGRQSLSSRFFFSCLLAAILLFAACSSSTDYPPSRVENVTDDIHGVKITDPYRWLEDQNSPETRAWIDAQNAYTDSFLQKCAGREKLRSRFTELFRIDQMGSPVVRNGRYFYSKKSAEQELTVYYYRDGYDGDEKLLIDPHGLSEDNRTSVSLMEVSEDGRLFAYGIRRGGEDEVELHWRDVETGEELPDILPRKRYSAVSILPDDTGFYYSVNDGEEVHHVFYHEMGRNPSEDKVIWGDGFKPGDIIDGSLSENGRYLILQASHGWSRSEIYFKDLRSDGPIRSVTGELEANFSAAVGGDTLFLHTNLDAPNYRIFSVDFSAPSFENWQEIVPQDEEAVLDSMHPAGGKLFLNYLRDVNTAIRIASPQGEILGEIELPSRGTAYGPSGRWSSEEAFYTFSSFHIPSTTFRYNTRTGEQDVWYRSPVRIDSDSIEVNQVWYRSKDDTPIPMFLVHRKDLVPDGENPVYLTGYGGFNISRRPAFSEEAVAWVEQGGVYALPNLRGGGEFGEAWHEAGMLGNKQNVFDDFIAAAEWLIENHYTNPGKLAIAGGSNGGLLVGAAFTQRPDLFQAVICSYPLLDMVRYHRFLVARFWVPEYGSSEDPEQLGFLRAYSPYQNVKPGTDYPAIMFVTGDADTRVAPLHARKMTALMQAAQGGTRPVLLKYDTKSGHSGGAPTSKEIEDATDEFCFLFQQLGMKAD